MMSGKIKKRLLMALSFGLIASAGIYVRLLLRAPDAASVNMEQHQQMEAAINCAALMAISEENTAGSLQPTSEAFKLIGYALGKAQEYALAAGQDIHAAQQGYNQKILDYFQQYAKDPEDNALNNQQYLVDCQNTYRALDPAEMIKAKLREAEAMANDMEAKEK